VSGILKFFGYSIIFIGIISGILLFFFFKDAGFFSVRKLAFSYGLIIILGIYYHFFFGVICLGIAKIYESQ